MTTRSGKAQKRKQTSYKRTSSSSSSSTDVIIVDEVMDLQFMRPIGAVEGDVYISKIEVGEQLTVELNQDRFFEDFYIKVTKTPKKEHGSRSPMHISLNFEKIRCLIENGKNLVEAIMRRGGNVPEVRRINIGGNYFLSVQEYMGSAAVDVRRFVQISGDYKPTKIGICLRVSNFSKVIAEMEKMMPIAEQMHADCRQILLYICEVEFRKLIVQKAMEGCEGCQDDIDDQTAHIGGCLTDWDELVDIHYQFSMVDRIRTAVGKDFTEAVRRRNLPNLYFASFYNEYTFNNDNGIKNDLKTSLTKSGKREVEISEMVYEIANLSLEQREICNNSM